MNRYQRNSLIAISGLSLLTGCREKAEQPAQYPVSVRAERINPTTIVIDRNNDGRWDDCLTFDSYSSDPAKWYGVFNEHGGLLEGHDNTKRAFPDKKFNLSQDPGYSLEALLKLLQPQ